MTTADADLASVAGLATTDSGQAILSGQLLELAERLDRRFLAIASRWDAVAFRFPAYIAAAELERIDYFRSFPHLATFPAVLDDAQANLDRFIAGEPVSDDGRVQPTELAPLRDVLTPAACYHLYAHHRGQRLDAARHSTTVATCFRREERYAPLERQWSFTMREIVCMGTGEEVRGFLAEATAEIDALVAELGLAVEWHTATDPFFRPSRNPQYLMQQVDPTKHELVLDSRLAIASANLHHDHFGRAFDIWAVRGPQAEPAHTGCVAFGMERWLSALLATFGPAAKDWPRLGDVGGGPA